VCDTRWYARSPTECMSCGAPKKKLRYREVPVESAELMVAGHADGLVDEGLIEVKSIGVGTLRFEAPGFHDKLQSGEWTLQETWNAIKRPFPTHIRQGMLYAFCKKVDQVIFIYECKWNQAVKEFIVKYDERLIAPVLSVCKDIKYAVETKRPMPRPDWANPEAKACKACPYNEVCYGSETSPKKRNKWRRIEP
jgi:CRISPR/Cas system-associated exonuclease Cas4 (RecB family)